MERGVISATYPSRFLLVAKESGAKKTIVAGEAVLMHLRLAELKIADSPALSAERCGFKHMRFSALCLPDA
ncbi:hypothetical protein A3A67_04055 [Candidatus Peribacteria bacterium RIFCSPLOWO2_01_FULL_51_18]|nr:MAG: hypothetical protein A3C52_04265 [Candidatus Peribacteria bacterium RIFCSPHIGHO2_02_FULL_51_15]OGJ65799.1 MAG: hypothetical protein A3A67_04055 [Candidatus Peribacteria bacterium RIFCSPLOWO2_01_FULL_51_18]OGJ68328.1 MAG: hypothetical protein A3J34_03370 [Candidatus Peribacteria bacterium RIFCSPLOWO2_02_FULL_51_10]